MRSVEGVLATMLALPSPLIWFDRLTTSGKGWRFRMDAARPPAPLDARVRGHDDVGELLSTAIPASERASREAGWTIRCAFPAALGVTLGKSIQDRRAS